jgi:cell division protein FtsN
MMWLLNLIPARIQYYLILAGVLIAGIFGVYWAGGQSKKQEIEAKHNKKRIKNMKIAKEVEDEVKALDDSNLRDRASKWVRRK